MSPMIMTTKGWVGSKEQTLVKGGDDHMKRKTGDREWGRGKGERGRAKHYAYRDFCIKIFTQKAHHSYR